MKTLQFSVLVAISMFVAMSACKKDDEKTGGSGCTDPKALNYDANATTSDGSCEYYQASANDTDASAASTGMAMMNEDANIFYYSTGNSSSASGKMAGADSSFSPPCAKTTWDSATRKLTIDFGTGCVGVDGKTRKGKLITKITSKTIWTKTGDSIIVSLENYSVNDTALTGTRTYWIKDQSIFTDGKMSVGLKVENASVTYPDNTSATWQGEGNYSYEGLKTATDITDDVMKIDFTGSGTTKDTITYSLTTPTPLSSKPNCLAYCPFVQGIVKVSSAKTEPYTFTVAGVKKTYDVTTTTEISLDFGDGTCDDGMFDVTTKVTAKTATQTLLDQTYGPEQYACSQLSTMQ